MFFVMLCGARNKPLPLGDHDTVALFTSYYEAVKAGGQNMIGKSHGYLVFPWPYTEGKPQ